MKANTTIYFLSYSIIYMPILLSLSFAVYLFQDSSQSFSLKTQFYVIVYLLILEVKMSTLNQSGEESSECPLCMEPLEMDDLSFYPCTCGYQVSHCSSSPN